jgi:hypothetical protein
LVIYTVVLLRYLIQLHNAIVVSGYTSKEATAKEITKEEKVPNPIATGLNKIAKKGSKQSFEMEENGGNDPKDGFKISQFVNVYNEIKPDTNATSKDMFITCLVYMIFDYLYFFAYLLPLTMAISLYDLDSGFTYSCLSVVIAYLSDGGGLFIGNAFGKNNFGAPITPSKTREGLYGSITFA